MTQGCCGLPLPPPASPRRGAPGQLVAITARGISNDSARAGQDQILPESLFLSLSETNFSPSLPARSLRATSSWHGLAASTLSQGCAPGRSKGLLACRSHSFYLSASESD